MRIFPLILAITLLIAPAAFAQDVQDDYQSDRTLADVTTQTDDLSTLSTAVQTAELADALAAEGPYTVFAPSNDAFDALPEGTVDALLMDENRDQLTGILTYHVVPGEYRAADLQDGQELQTLSGDTLTVRVVDGAVTVNGAEVAVSDVEASNGIAHVISGVLLPPVAEPATEVDPTQGMD